jgi:hypothetical protein
MHDLTYSQLTMQGNVIVRSFSSPAYFVMLEVVPQYVEAICELCSCKLGHCRIWGNVDTSEVPCAMRASFKRPGANLEERMTCQKQRVTLREGAVLYEPDAGVRCKNSTKGREGKTGASSRSLSKVTTTFFCYLSHFQSLICVSFL